jgi:Phosphate-selective porin O and P
MTTRHALGVASLVALTLASSRASAVNVYEDKDHDRSFDIGVLLQPQIAVTKDGAANGQTSVDLFLRRARLYAAGSVSKEFSFFFDIDEPNWGKGGNWLTDKPLVQDAIMTWSPDRAINVDAGYMLVPFSHQALEGAGALHALDYRTLFLPYPAGAGTVARDVGVVVRGLLLSDYLYYRVGAFEGVRPEATTLPGQTALNDVGLPRFAGTLRLNLAGAEDKLYFHGLYFAEKTMLSIGLGGDYQMHAVRDATGAVKDYLALSADVYFEHPFSADDEIIAKANFVHASQEPISKIGGNGGFVEAGFRHAWIEPIAAFEYWQGDDSSQKVMSIDGGVNIWAKKHQVNVKLDARWTEKQLTTGGVTTTTDSFVATLQGQVWF